MKQFMFELFEQELHEQTASKIDYNDPQSIKKRATALFKENNGKRNESKMNLDTSDKIKIVQAMLLSAFQKNTNLGGLKKYNNQWNIIGDRNPKTDFVDGQRWPSSMGNLTQYYNTFIRDNKTAGTRRWVTKDFFTHYFGENSQQELAGENYINPADTSWNAGIVIPKSWNVVLGSTGGSSERITQDEFAWVENLIKVWLVELSLTTWGNKFDNAVMQRGKTNWFITNNGKLNLGVTIPKFEWQTIAKKFLIRSTDGATVQIVFDGKNKQLTIPVSWLFAKNSKGKLDFSSPLFSNTLQDVLKKEISKKIGEEIEKSAKKFDKLYDSFPYSLFKVSPSWSSSVIKLQEKRKELFTLFNEMNAISQKPEYAYYEHKDTFTKKLNSNSNKHNYLYYKILHYTDKNKFDDRIQEFKENNLLLETLTVAELTEHKKEFHKLYGTFFKDKSNRELNNTWNAVKTNYSSYLRYYKTVFNKSPIEPDPIAAYTSVLKSWRQKIHEITKNL